MSLLIRLLVGFCLLTHDLFAETVQPDFTLLIPMRDGTQLPTDIYLPSQDLKKYPCILMRNPSGKRADPWVRYAELAKCGYVVAIQDARNVLDVQGRTMPYWSDGWGVHQDGYDTVEWLAKSPFTDGNIGTIGFSAPGITQLLMAPSAPPSLKFQYVGVAAANLYDQCIFNGGQILKNQVEGWLKSHGNNQGLLGYITGQPYYNEFWDQLNTVKVAEKVKVPGFHYGGWYDIFLQGTIDAFASRQYNGGEGAKGKQKLLIGPWIHSWPLHQQLGDFEVPLTGKLPPYDTSPQRLFDHHLKGIDQQYDDLPAIAYYVMGPFDGSPSSGNVWKTANEWPIPAKMKPLYLATDNKLSWEPSSKNSQQFNSDPENPVPTLGGRNLFLESGPKDQRSIEERDDVLVFTSEPLEADLEVTGRIMARIYLQTDREDTDIALRLTDVYPDGRSVLITDGICRLAHQKCLMGDETCGKLEKLSIDLFTTSIVFAKGHSIRLSVSGSNFPRYEKNLNVKFPADQEQKPEIARNTVHFGQGAQSFVLLPIVN